MGDLISRSALIKKMQELKSHMVPEEDGRHAVSIEKVIDFIGACPTVEAEPVAHGKWNGVDHDMFFECSICGYLTDYMLTNFCPHCGAKMDGV